MKQVYTAMAVILKYATPKPKEIINTAIQLTMKKDLINKDADEKVIRFLLSANHTSLFEHINYTFLVKGVSRSFLAQLSRHRMASLTTGSQHYQDYRDYPFIMSETVANNLLATKTFDQITYCYKHLREIGILPEEARQILPNACEVQLLWTINARSLINFLNLRLCRRNVREMLQFAILVKNLLLDHFPELFKHIGPDCIMHGRCMQEHLGCNTHEFS